MSDERICENCGEEFDYEEEGETLDVEGVVCGYCYKEACSDCQICCESVDPSRVSEYILVKTELSATAYRPPGIYKIARYPFLSIPMIGSGSLFASDVMFIAKLPKTDAEYEISGHICRECAAPYEQSYKTAYGSLSPEIGIKERWELEKDHTRSVILANPDMLRNLECDSHDNRDPNDGPPYPYSDDWLEIKRIYDLPDLPTYHPRVFVEHGVVTVYFPHEKKRCGTLLIRPEPMYRSCHDDKFSFYPESLPTWKESDKSNDRYYGGYEAEALRAVTEAIDRGILTQEGIV